MLGFKLGGQRSSSQGHLLDFLAVASKEKKRCWPMSWRRAFRARENYGFGGNWKYKAPFSSRNFLTLSKIQNMKIFNVF